MRTVIFPTIVDNTKYVNLTDVTDNDLIIAYVDGIPIGFVVYNYEGEYWTIQTSSNTDKTVYFDELTLPELVTSCIAKYSNFELKVLNCE